LRPFPFAGTIEDVKTWFWILLWASLLLGSACGSDLVWFVSWNTGPVQTNGLVVIIGTPHEQPLESVQLVDGAFPKGMQIEPDGTVQGIPEESGKFNFTLELTETSGKVLQEGYSVEVDPDSMRR